MTDFQRWGRSSAIVQFCDEGSWTMLRPGGRHGGLFGRTWMGRPCPRVPALAAVAAVPPEALGWQGSSCCVLQKSGAGGMPKSPRAVQFVRRSSGFVATRKASPSAPWGPAAANLG